MKHRIADIDEAITRQWRSVAKQEMALDALWHRREISRRQWLAGKRRLAMVSGRIGRGSRFGGGL